MRRTTETTTILGVDAAWTAPKPSGVALVQRTTDAWRCVTAAPSYDEFYGAAAGREIRWETSGRCCAPPNLSLLCDTACELAGTPVDLIAVDMPVATVAISGRRNADIAVSREFGSRRCPAHSPSAARPGRIGADFASDARALGFELATTNKHWTGNKRLLEVYPNPALLSLLERGIRVKYKAGKTRKYWPSDSVRQRIASLLTEYRAIYDALVRAFGNIALDLPSAEEVPTLASLKSYEDALDALVCAWVGTQYVEGRTVALGDETAAVWCPRDVVRGAQAPVSRMVSPE